MTVCDSAAPPAMQHASAPDANPCAVFGKVAPMAFVAHGKMPAWAAPISPHSSANSANPVATPASAVNPDHATAKSASAALLPSGWFADRVGSWNAAYPAYHASQTSPIACGVSDSSAWIAFDGTLSADRWR